MPCDTIYDGQGRAIGVACSRRSSAPRCQVTTAQARVERLAHEAERLLHDTRVLRRERQALAARLRAMAARLEEEP